MSVPSFLENFCFVLCADLLLREYKANRAVSLPSKLSQCIVVTGSQRYWMGEGEEASYVTGRKQGDS